MTARLTPEQMARDILVTVCTCAVPTGEEVEALASAIRSAEREAAAEALERAAQKVAELACQDYCEHEYCVAAHDARSQVRAMKPSEGK